MTAEEARLSPVMRDYSDEGPLKSRAAKRGPTGDLAGSMAGSGGDKAEGWSVEGREEWKTRLLCNAMTRAQIH